MGVLFVLLILIPFSPLAIMMAWIGLYKDPKHASRYAWLYIYGIFIVSYCFVPDHTLDVSRYWEQIDLLRGFTLSEVIAFLKDGLLIENFIFWCFSKVDIPHLLPALSTTIVYGVSIYIIVDVCKRYKGYNALFYAVLFQTLLFPYLSIEANVRNICTFAIGTFAAYRELVQKKRDLITLAGYILPFFMHKTGIIIFIVRLLVIVFKKAVVPAVSIVVLLPSIITLAYNNVNIITIPGSIGIVLRKLIVSSNNYLIGGSDYAERLAQGHAYIIKYSTMAVIIVQAILLYRYYKEHLDDDLLELAVFTFLLTMVSLATSVFDTPAYWRFAMAGNISFGAFLIYYFGAGQVDFKIKGVYFKAGMLILAGVRFVLEAYRSIPRTDIRATFELLATTNLYTILITFFKEIINI